VIKADIDRRVTVMLAEAERKSRQLRGEGDAEASRIYAETYNRMRSFSVSCAVSMPIAPVLPAVKM